MRKKKVLKILSIMVLTSLFLIPVVFAIYRSSILGDGSLSTANWQVSINQTNENGNLSIVPGTNQSEGTTASYAVNITSNSEVDAVYSIVIDNLPTGVGVSLDGGSFVQEVNNTVVFSSVGTILYNDSNKTRRHVLTFKAASGASVVNNQSIDVNVIAKQAL